jgi:hypothetical protein
MLKLPSSQTDAAPRPPSPTLGLAVLAVLTAVVVVGAWARNPWLVGVGVVALALIAAAAARAGAR